MGRLVACSLLLPDAGELLGAPNIKMAREIAVFKKQLKLAAWMC